MSSYPKTKYGKFIVDFSTKKKIRKMFYQKRKMELIEVETGLTERVIRRIIKEKNWIKKRERYYKNSLRYAIKNHISMHKLSVILKIPESTLHKIRKKYKLEYPRVHAWNKRITDEVERQMIEDYSVNKETGEFIAKKYGFNNRKTVFDVLDKFGVEKRLPKVETSYNLDFFEEINSSEKAYILGLIMTDGYILKDYQGFGIQLTKGDKYLLENISKHLGESATVVDIKVDKKREKLPNAKDMARLTVHNRKIAEDLKTLGVVRNKSKILRYKKDLVRPEYLGAFFRGLIDGDGCIGIYNNHVQIQLCSASEKFIEDLYEINKNMFSIHHSFTERDNKRSEMNVLYIKNGKMARLDFLKWIYSNKGNLFLERKYEKIKDQIS